MIYCPLCGTTNRRGSKYCNECGVRFDPSMQSKCPKCGALNAISDALCSGCGEPLVPAPLEEGLDTQGKTEEGGHLPPTLRSGTPSWLDGFPPIVAREVPSEAGTRADRVEAAREWLRQTSFGPEAWQKTDLLSGVPLEEGQRTTPVPGAISRSSSLLAGIQDPLPASSLLAQPSLATRSSSTESSPQADEANLAIQLEAARYFSQIMTLQAGMAAVAGNQPDRESLPGSDRATGIARPSSIESILAIDYGSTQTRTFLLSLVEDEYRLIAWAEAPSTWGPPWHDVAVSVRQAVDRMTATTGLRILDEQGQILVPEGQPGGVDAVVSTSSAGSPLRLILVAPTQQTALETTQRALSHSYATIEGLVTAHKGQEGVLIDDLEGQVRLAQELVPDAIVVLGGEDRDAGQAVLASLETMGLACAAMQPAEGCPPIIYVGNGSSRPMVEQITGAGTRLRVVDDLQAALKELQLQRQMQDLPGYGLQTAWSPAQTLPTASALACTTQYLAQYAMSDQDHPAGQMANVLTVDVGGMTTAAAVVLDGLPDLFVWRGLGTSHSISGILNHIALESVLSWLPSPVDATEARNILFDKELHPHTLPQTVQDLFLEQAVAREILGWISTAWVGRQKAGVGAGLAPQFDLIVGTGGVLGNAPNPGMAALMLLDGLQPVGISSLILDHSGLMASAGAIASINPLAAVQLLERDALLRLGTVVAPMGAASEGQVVLLVKIEYEDGRAMEVSAPFGSLEVLPLPAGQRATLEIRPAPRFALPGAPRGRAIMKEVEGGTLGVIIDVRGRPLRRVEDAEEQRTRNQRWLANLGAQGPW